MTAAANAMRSSVRSTSVAPRSIFAAAGAAMAIGAVAPAMGQTATWNNFSTSSATFAAGPFNPANPAASIDTTLLFRNIYISGGGTASNAAGPYQLNGLTFDNQGDSSFTVSASVAGNVLQFRTSTAGVAPTITQAGAQVGVFTAGIDLPTDNALTVLGSGRGNLTLPATITGGRTAGTDSLLLNATGGGFVNWGMTSAVGAYTGNTRLQGGILNLASSAVFGASNQLIVDGGTLLTNSSGITLAGNMILNTDLLWGGTWGFTMNGAISGTGGIRNQIGFPSNTATFTANNTFQGSYHNQAYGNTALTTVLSGAGRFSGTNLVRIGSGQRLTLDNGSVAVVDRINDAAVLQLDRGVMALNGSSLTATNTSETISRIDTSGSSAIRLVPTTAGNTTLISTNGISRINNGTLFFITSTASTSLLGANAIGGSTASSSNISLGVAPTLLGTVNTPGSIAGPGAVTNLGIIPWATSSTGVGQLNSFMTYSTSNGLRPLAAAEYRTGGTTGNSQLLLDRGSTLDTNSRFVSSGSTTYAGQAGMDGTTVFNSFLLDSPTSGSPMAFVYGSGNIFVNSGGFMSGLSGGTTVSSSSDAIVGVAGLSGGYSELVLNIANNTTILADITGKGGVTRAGTLSDSSNGSSGNPNLTLVGNNRFVGDFTINGGLTNVIRDNNMGLAGQSRIVLAGGVAGSGTGSYGANGLLQFNPVAIWGGNETQTLANGREVVVVGSGGSLGAALQNDVFKINGVVSGSAPLMIEGSGTVNLTNSANTYSGGTILRSGILQIASNGALGAAAGDIVLAGGTLRVDGAMSTSRNVQVQASSNILANADLTLNGVLRNADAPNSSSSGNLTIFGSGNVTMTANNPFTGGLIVGGQTTPLGNQSTVATGTRVTLSGNGTLASAREATTDIVVNAGAGLVLDNSATNVNNRLPTAAVGLNAGSLTILGNAAANTNEAIGSFTVGGSALTPTSSGVSTVTLDANGSATGVTLTAQSWGTISAGAVLVRGDNLGAVAPTVDSSGQTAVANAAAGGSNFFVGNNPALNGNALFGTLIPTSPAGTFATNTYGTIAHTVVDTSATGNGTNLASYDNNRGIIPLAVGSLTALPTTGGVSTTTYGITAATVLTGNVTTGNMHLSTDGANTGSIALGANTLSLNGGTLLSTGVGANTITTTGTGATAQLLLGGNGLIFNNNNLNLGTAANPVAYSSSTSILKGGVGNLTVFAAAGSSITPAWVIGQGTLTYGNTNAIAVAGSLMVAQGATVDMSATAGANTIAIINGYGTVNLGANNLTHSGTNSAFQGSLVGSGNLTIGSGGGGSMTIQGASPNWTGQTTINGGTLSLQSNDANALGSGASDLLIGSGANTGTLTLGASVTSFGRNMTMQGTSGTRTVIQTAAATNPTITGNITLNRSMRFAGSGTINMAGIIADGISGPAAATEAVEWFSGNLNLLNSNTFRGNFTANATPSSVLGLGVDSVLSGSTIVSGPIGTGNLAVPVGFSLRAVGGSRTLHNPVTYSAGVTTTFGGTDSVTLAGAINFGSGSQTMSVVSNQPMTLAGNITGTGTAFTKTGGGTLVMGGTNSFSTANFTVSQGALLVNGTNSGTGTYTVNGGALLGGTGIINAGTTGVTINSNGILSPGASAGTLTINGNLNMAANNADLLVELTNPGTLVSPGSDIGIPNAGSDTVVVVGNLAIPTIASTNRINVSVTMLPGSGAGTYQLISYTGTLTGDLAVNNTAFNVSFVGGTPSWITGYSVDTASRTIAGGDTVNRVLLTVIPTPGSAALVGLAGLIASGRRRRAA